ncbi:MAG: LmeA family phospholipid-binding protein [Armatimonadetes bacterium]|nr:LmeA family phospholipid-binding protein [Armatimonadota bacterium]
MGFRQILIFFLASVVVATGCTPGERQVEQAIQRELPRLVGPAASYHVDIQGLQGARSAERVTATGRRVRPEGSPVLDHVAVELNGVTYDTERGQLERVENAEVIARVQAADLATFLEAQRTLRDVTVDLEPPARVRVRARPEIPGLEIPPGVLIDAEGRLVGEGARVRYDIDRVHAAGATLPGGVVVRLSNAINPVVDLSRIPVILRVVELRVEGESMVIRATGRYPQ